MHRDRIACLPYAAVRFDRRGDLVDESEVDHLRGQLANGVTDLIVMSHGWNTNIEEAEDLYQRFFGHLCDALPAEDRGGLAVLGVLWPSKRFTDPDQIPGGAASLRRGLRRSDIDRAAEQLEGLLEPSDVARATELLGRVGDSPDARRALTSLLQDYLKAVDLPPEEAPSALLDEDGDRVFREFEKSFSSRSGLRPSNDDDAEGGAAGLFTGSAGGAALNFLNVFTYYTMRHRAGEVGTKGLNPLLRRLRSETPTLRLHLVGHSFGARLVTAAVSGGENPLAVRSLTLLQAAFSHYAFAEKFDGRTDGGFRNVVSDDLVAGPILITHTRNDRAVGIAYALASRLGRQVAMAIGDRSDRYGGLGRNGAHPEKTPEANDIGSVSLEGRSLEPGEIYNLLADEVIGNHSDIAHPETARLLLPSIARGRGDP